MKKMYAKILSISTVVLMLFSLCACNMLDEEESSGKNVDINRSDIPKSQADIVDYYNNVVLALLKENADKVTCDVVLEQNTKEKTYVKVNGYEAYECSLAELLELNAKIEDAEEIAKEATEKAAEKTASEAVKKDAKDKNAEKDALSKEKEDKENNQIKSAAKGLINLILKERKERDISQGLPVTGDKLMPASIASIDGIAKIKSILGDDTSNHNLVKPGVYYTLNFTFEDFTDPDANSALSKFIDLPDLKAYKEELGTMSDYLKVNNHTIDYKGCKVSVDVDQTNDQIAYITYTINAAVKVEVEGTGKLEDAKTSTVEFNVERVLKFQFDWSKVNTEAETKAQ